MATALDLSDAALLQARGTLESMCHQRSVITFKEIAEVLEKCGNQAFSETFPLAQRLEQLCHRFDVDGLLVDILCDWANQLKFNDQFGRTEPFPGLPPVFLDTAYVEPRFTARLRERDSDFGVEAHRRSERQECHISDSSTLIQGLNGVSIVLGEPGAGKSTLTHVICRSLVRKQQGTMTLPVLVRLRDHYGDGTILRSFWESTLGIEDHPTITRTDNALRRLHTRVPQEVAPRITFLLDGLDEYTGSTPHLIRQIHYLASIGPVLITTRPGIQKEYLQLASTIYYILPMTLLDMRCLTERLLVDHNDQVRLFRHLDQHPDFRRLATNPFVLTASCALHRTPELYQSTLPSNRTELLNALVEAGFTHEARDFDTSSQSDDAPPVRTSIRRLAAWMQLDAEPGRQLQFDEKLSGATRHF